MKRTIRIATRGSPLALAQAGLVRNHLTSAHPRLGEPGAIEITSYKTTGDKQQSGLLTAIGGKGLFTKEIEEALLVGQTDIAVHSMKDLPSVLPEGLILGAFLPREDPRDALVAHTVTSLDDLPAGALVGTASLRRKAILLSQRPDICIEPLRGNVETRLRNIEAGKMDATFLAVAGLIRLGLIDRASALLDPDVMLPALCQGAIGIECREDDKETQKILSVIDHRETRIVISAERAFLAALDGSCRTPIAGLATLQGSKLLLRGLIVRPDGTETHASQDECDAVDAEMLGQKLGKELRSRAAPDFFREPD